MTLMDKLWQKIKVASGACAANVQLDDLKDYLERESKQPESRRSLSTMPTGLTS